MSQYTAEEYLNLSCDEMPYTTNFGLTICEIDIHCPECNSSTENNKYTFNDFNNSTDLISVGICKKCNLIVTGKKMRFYQDGRFSWLDEDGWKTRKQKTISMFKKYLYKLMGKK